MVALSILLLLLYLFLSQRREQRHHHDPRIRGILSGPRLPTGSTVDQASIRAFAQSGRNGSGILSRDAPSAGHAELSSNSETTLVSVSPSPPSLLLPEYHAYAPDVGLETNAAHQDVGLQTSSTSIICQTVFLPSIRTAGKGFSPVMISPLPPVSPFADFDTYRIEAEKGMGEVERNRGAAYRMLSGEIPAPIDELVRELGRVSRGRREMMVG